jgi:hypothetical protein
VSKTVHRLHSWLTLLPMDTRERSVTVDRVSALTVFPSCSGLPRCVGDGLSSIAACGVGTGQLGDGRARPPPPVYEATCIPRSANPDRLASDAASVHVGERPDVLVVDGARIATIKPFLAADAGSADGGSSAPIAPFPRPDPAAVAT